MATDGVNVKESRLSTRIALQCSIIVANGLQTGEGQVLNLSKHGCLVESPLPIKAGDHLQLRLFLPDSDQSVCASLAVVRWVQATLFGVEFLTIDEKYRSRLNQFIAMGNDPWQLAL
jgi:c-di-GMP-binding flagellar brake protein YcgR